MKFSTLPLALVSVLICSVWADATDDTPAAVTTYVEDAEAAGIDLNALPFSSAALAEIDTLIEASTSNSTTRRSLPNEARASASYIDVHTHIVPEWYRAIYPVTGGNPTPVWNMTAELAFMQSQGIARSIVSISAPGATTIFRGNQALTTSLARVLNVYAAAMCQQDPTRFSFYAVVPLPYTDAAIAEAKYALDTLGAVGVILLSNHEGLYLGNPQFKKFFTYLNGRSSKEIIYVHPNTPWLNSNGNLVEANPTLYATGVVEFFFETARTIMDLTYTQTIHNNTHLHFVIPHVGGAFPSIMDRMLKSAPALDASSKAIYNTRFWWDSAGPTYYAQVKGLLDYGVPKSQLLFGTDFPYAPSFTFGPSTAAIQNADFLTAAEKAAIFIGNAKTLFAGKINF